ncbi:MAG: U32 family peptidase [Oscillospiraceae bacterium]|nr:U32 family peptidase [Oscillospiraceae bacterium]
MNSVRAKKPLPEVCRLLAPAGNKECLDAALRAGADGVYFGAKSLNARQKADNFGPEDLLFAADECRAYGAESFLTLNTLLKKEEQKEAFYLLEQAAKVGITGVIVQDLSLPERIKRTFPSLEIHASTQMAVTTSAGIRLLQEMGFDQAVLARECAKEEIAEMAKTGMKLETFCHGALCMGLSGQCYLSALIGGRSGNRGLCAQPCRLDFSIKGFEKCLSLKDLCLIGHLEELKKMGVRTLKIEGRMKRPEYVTATVSAYRAALDGENFDTDLLQRVFSRSGFTTGMFEKGGRPDRSMFGFRRKEDIDAADRETFSSLQRQKEKDPVRVPLSARLEIAAEKPVLLEVSDGNHRFVTEGMTPSAARERSVQKDRMEQLLSQTGETRYFFSETEIILEEGLFLPDSAVRQLRRTALEEMDRQRKSFPVPEKAHLSDFLTPETGKRTNPQTFAAICRTAEQAREAEILAKEIYLPLDEAVLFAPQKETTSVGVLLPPVFFAKKEEVFLERVKKAGFDRVLARSPGGWQAAKEMGFFVTLGPTLNIRSREAESTALRFGADEVIRSFESSLFELSDCTDKSGLIVYGRLPLMVLRLCPNKAKNGCASCKKHFEISDRTGRTFPVFCGGEASVVYNSQVLYLADRLEKYDRPAKLFLLFSDEDAQKTGEICISYANQTPPTGSFTRGLYERKAQKDLPQKLRDSRAQKTGRRG